MNIHAVIGDEIVVDQMHLGQPPRKGEILDVLGEGDTEHYSVRWDDGHVSMFYPATSSRAIHLAKAH